MLEKLLEVNVRMTEVKGDKKLQAKIQSICNKLLDYFDKQVDKTLRLHEKYDNQWR